MARRTASTAPPQVVAEVAPAAGSTVADVRAGLELARDALSNLSPEAALQFGPRPSISGLRVKHYRDQVDRLLAVIQGAPAGPSAA